ncbi:two-component system response regulator YesN [Lachnotalea glycerini]|uniref:Stage 0 sporulation protein A homolog n=1 Tax=Lachnotalea glycerini TaxID=1763509 RepID=A0A318EM85_9FIRM|nr:response regulator [Lachnotalea glycerini]PXV89215.1 two-component system response regulator YesN [Lachnotalea glycerini]
MLQVLLVDDEPFIVQGLKVLIDWKEQGYEIAGTAANGMEALNFLHKTKVDLIIADIKMPVMTGLELLEVIRKEKISDAYFVILSGYGDFNFAQQAIRNNCLDYILKPVLKEELIKILEKLLSLNQGNKLQQQTDQRLKKAYLARNMISLIFGKYDQINLDYIYHQMHLSNGVRYIGIELDHMGQMEEFMDEEKRLQQRKLYDSCLEFLGEDGDHCILDVSSHEKSYDIGFIYCDYMANYQEICEKEYLEKFLKFLNCNTEISVVMLVGKKVADISQISKSYGTSCVLRSFQAFRVKRNIYFYEEEVQVNSSGILLCKESLDALLFAVEQNDKLQIITSVENLYKEMNQMGFNADTVDLNINYLLFQFIHLATQQDSYVNQEEIMHFISENTFEGGVMRGSKAHLSRFACEYAQYLAQLRKNVSRGVLYEVEKDIRENYAQNLTLRDLSKKYYVNSAYLGQMFRKKYGQSFKDYLNNYRIDQAVIKLLRTDEKIYRIAEEVGYHDLDYFVNRFITVKGCTPAKFRKHARQ